MRIQHVAPLTSVDACPTAVICDEALAFLPGGGGLCPSSLSRITQLSPMGFGTIEIAIGGSVLRVVSQAETERPWRFCVRYG